MEKLNEIVTLNSSIVIGVEDHIISVQVYDNGIEIPYKPNIEQKSIQELLLPYKGKRVAIINSDVLGIVNQKIKVKELEKHIVTRIQLDVLNEYLPYLAKIAKEEENQILIQSTYNLDNPELTLTAGILDDIQVVLFDIHYERNERRI